MNPCVVCPAGHPVVVHPSRLGSEVACPRCLEFFLAEIPRMDAEFASKDTGKRPAKKKPDDDDEEEDEKPRKKKPDKPAKETKDDKKKPAAKKKQKEEDEEDEDEDDEEADPEDDITWSARKYGLKTCHSGLAIVNFGYFGLIALYVITLLGVSLASSGIGMGNIVVKFGGLATAHIALALFVVGMFMNIRVPAKAEAGVGLYSSIALGLFTFFVAIIMIVANTGAFFEDPARTERFVGLLFGALVLCYLATWMAMMGYLCSVLSFMRMTNDASAPITNGVFGSLPFVGMLALHFFGGALRSGIGDFMNWVIIGVSVAMSGYGIYMMVLQLLLTAKLRAKIWDHIVWE